MSRLDVDEVLFEYIVVAIHAVSLVLIRDDDSIQRPVYYVSKSLHEAEVCYLPLEKAILAIVHATRKLPYYFQSHTVVVLTQFPLKSMLQKFAEPSLEESVKELHMDGKLVGMIICKELPVWKVYVDGAANQRGSGVGLVLVSPEGLTFEKSLRLGFPATNNEAEYEVVLVGLGMVKKMGRKSVQMFSDSQLVVGQVIGTLEARDSRMQEYLTKVRYLRSKFDSFILTHVSKSANTQADSLATLATSSAQGLPRVILVEDLLKPARTSIDVVCIHQVRLGPSWMDPITSFLKSDVLPEDRSKVDKVRRKAPWF
ncbi:uncharacterized protein LOC142632517 [Castanea sativa]|uniref:uncharacterized protein LOC142632517 n=1 Tax=Castanea sativa TaxID=21020 RepID=UPI003F64CD27